MHQTTKLSFGDILSRLTSRGYPSPSLRAYGVPRGGTIVAPFFGRPVDSPEEADIIVDDVIDTGGTEAAWRERFPSLPFEAVIDLRVERHLGWVQFPWEAEPEIETEANVVRLLQALGEDPTREGLRDTPRRYLSFLKEFMSPALPTFTQFEPEGYGGMIIQTGIPFWSLCEHHLLPFFGTAAVAYLPGHTIVGLSKLARTVDYAARRLQNQERLTQMIVDTITRELQPVGVACLVRARHLCMEMRGVEKHDTWTTTSCLRGPFLTQPEVRSEFLSFAMAPVV